MSEVSRIEDAYVSGRITLQEGALRILGLVDANNVEEVLEEVSEEFFVAITDLINTHDLPPRTYPPANVTAQQLEIARSYLRRKAA